MVTVVVCELPQLLVKLGREAPHRAQHRLVGGHDIADRHLRVRDVCHRQDNARIVGELDVDLGVGVPTQQLVVGDTDYLPVGRGADRRTGYGAHVEAGGRC